MTASLLKDLFRDRFNSSRNKQENDLKLLSEILLLTSSFLEIKLKIQAKSLDKNKILAVSREISEKALQIRSRKYKKIKNEVVDIVGESINSFQLDKFEKLQLKIESILRNN